ncbi:hypothetical protein FOL47_002769 [Perkinsus chesapeaki]|uniref:Non-canonical E2 ubiquitin-conjugating enzyme C-terminal domain-containing protein n=1 Tax=Perkinsus chesapeaki TaxID=330153 RepID=A0A7J6N0H3_PERCH|nr:hypothetical protein FOL47_002769 [Perkinsus chesapeaki]
MTVAPDRMPSSAPETHFYGEEEEDPTKRLTAVLDGHEYESQSEAPSEAEIPLEVLPQRLGALNERELRDLLLKLPRRKEITAACQSRVDVNAEATTTEAECVDDQYRDKVLEKAEADMDSASGGHHSSQASYLNLCSFIPVRLSHDDRRALNLLERALNVSEYTDKVDVYTIRHEKDDLIIDQLDEACSILSGMSVASHQRPPTDFQHWYQRVFEVGRRYKMLNPERFRDNYGKLMYMLMDANRVRDRLQFELIMPIKTIYTEYSSLGHPLEDLLMDSRLPLAVHPAHNKEEAAVKTAAREDIAARHGDKFKPEQFDGILDSLEEFEEFREHCSEPATRMKEYLQHYFSPTDETSGPDGVSSRFCSLRLRYGEGGARLSHDHRRQYQYVLQSLTLWDEVLRNLIQLWHMVENDTIIKPVGGYRLADTGQGLNRIQQAPSVYRAMNQILGNVQQKLGGWTGSSVVHMGDHNVPNALVFLDKYCQIPRILSPICHCLDRLAAEYDARPGIRDYIDSTFGGVDGAKRIILHDFFKHGFDGSGADNFFDAGSCIDGRLTSAWNWCSQIEKKVYFPLFLLTGFTGFDGEEDPCQVESYDWISADTVNRRLLGFHYEFASIPMDNLEDDPTQLVRIMLIDPTYEYISIRDGFLLCFDRRDDDVYCATLKEYGPTSLPLKLMPKPPDACGYPAPICIRGGLLFRICQNNRLYALKIEGGETWIYVTTLEGEIFCRYDDLDIDFGTSDSEPTEILVLHKDHLEKKVLYFKDVANEHLSTRIEIGYPTGSIALIPNSGGIACLNVKGAYCHHEEGGRTGIWIVDPHTGAVLYLTGDYSFTIDSSFISCGLSSIVQGDAKNTRHGPFFRIALYIPGTGKYS